MLDTVLRRLAMHARVVLCGAIAVYNAEHKPPGPANYLELITARARMEGFNAFDHWDRFGEITRDCPPSSTPAAWSTANTCSTASTGLPKPSTCSSPATTPASSSSRSLAPPVGG